MPKARRAMAGGTAEKKEEKTEKRDPPAPMAPPPPPEDKGVEDVDAEAVLEEMKTEKPASSVAVNSFKKKEPQLPSVRDSVNALFGLDDDAEEEDDESEGQLQESKGAGGEDEAPEPREEESGGSGGGGPESSDERDADGSEEAAGEGGDGAEVGDPADQSESPAQTGEVHGDGVGAEQADVRRDAGEGPGEGDQDRSEERQQGKKKITRRNWHGLSEEERRVFFEEQISKLKGKADDIGVEIILKPKDKAGSDEPEPAAVVLSGVQTCLASLTIIQETAKLMLDTPEKPGPVYTLADLKEMSLLQLAHLIEEGVECCGKGCGECPS